jgi:hypothetical protein
MLHSQISLLVRKGFPLTLTTIARLPEQFCACDFLIVDEKSMTGLKTLDQQLRQISPSWKDELFGGSNILLCSRQY